MRANLIFCCGVDGGADAEKKNHSQPQGSHVLLGAGCALQNSWGCYFRLPFWGNGGLEPCDAVSMAIGKGLASILS